ncbi:ABC transporter ATP-binding protein [Streptomyces sp. HD1123-B1]|uniref:ABC transporter ATP-binding protein n=1 Tax=Streptomyces huangiella TaxID=3228804 RepID=UPI003D7D1B1E
MNTRAPGGDTATAELRTGDRLLLAAFRHGGPWTAVLMATASCATAAELCLPALLGRALDDSMAGERAGSVVVCGAVVLVLVVCDAVTELAAGAGAARYTSWFRRRLLTHVLSLGPRGVARFPEGDLVSRMAGGASDAALGVATVIWTALSLVPTAGSVVALVLIDPWLAVTFLLVLPFLWLVLRSFSRDMSEVAARYQRTQGALSTALAEALAGARTIAASGTAARETERVLGGLPALSRLGYRMWRAQALMAARTALLVPALEVAVLAVAGFLLAQGRVSAGEMVAAAQYAALGAGLGTTSMLLGRLARCRAGAHRVAEVFEEPPMVYGTRSLPRGDGRLELRDIVVSRSGERVLDGVDLLVPGGTSVAVVGRSGGGKTLLAAVAGRLDDPDRGTVLLDGVPLTELSHEALRTAVGYAFERPVLAGATIADAIGQGGTAPPLAVVEHAARQACADDFVRRLPEGYATPLAEVPMSGGEAQRIGLARAFARPGRVLVLDDAMSSLDSVTEHHIGRALTAMGDRTRIIIAHRASTAAAADSVVWLDGGRVRRQGAHRELWREPAYRAMFRPDSGRSGQAANGGRLVRPTPGEGTAPP